MFIDLKPRLNTIGTKPVERYTNVWRFKCVCFIRFRLVEFAKYNLQWAYCIKNESALSHPLSDQMTGKHDQITEVEYLHEEDCFQFLSKSSFSQLHGVCHWEGVPCRRGSQRQRFLAELYRGRGRVVYTVAGPMDRRHRVSKRSANGQQPSLSKFDVMRTTSALMKNKLIGSSSSIRRSCGR